MWLTDSHRHDSGLRDPDRTIVRISVAPVPSTLYRPLWRELCDNRTAVEQDGGDPAAWYLTNQPMTAEHWGTVNRIDPGKTLHSTDLTEQPVSAWATSPSPPGSPKPSAASTGSGHPTRSAPTGSAKETTAAFTNKTTAPTTPPTPSPAQTPHTPSADD